MRFNSFIRARSVRRFHVHLLSLIILCAFPGVVESNNTSITNFVVAIDGSGDYLTVQNAIDAALSSGGNATVWIKNGSYFENLILHDRINLVGASGLGDLGDVEITGTHTPPQSGHIILRNIRWNSDQYILYSEEQGTSHIVFMDALLNVKDGYSCFLPYWDGTKGGILEFYDINPGLSNQSNDGAIYNPYGGVQVFLYDAGLGMGKTKSMIVSGQMVMQCAAVRCPIQFNSGAVLTCDSSIIEEGLTFEGNSRADVSNSRITGLSCPTIVMNSSHDINLNTCVVDGINKPIIDGHGSGNLNICGCSFPRGLDIIATVNQYNEGVLKTGSLEVSSEKIQILGGDGPPTMSASKGSLYLRSDGFSGSTRMYVNIDGEYTWTPVLTES